MTWLEKAMHLLKVKFKPAVDVSFSLGGQFPREWYKQPVTFQNVGGWCFAQEATEESSRIEIKGNHDGISKGHFTALEHSSWFY